MLEDKLMATNVFSLLIQDPGWGSIIINNQSLRGTEPGQPISLHEPPSPPNSGWSRIHRAVITNDKCSFRQLHDWILTKHHFNLRLHCLTVDRAVTVEAAIHNVAFKNQWIHRQDWQPLLALTHSAYKKKTNFWTTLHDKPQIYTLCNNSKLQTVTLLWSWNTVSQRQHEYFDRLLISDRGLVDL